MDDTVRVDRTQRPKELNFESRRKGKEAIEFAYPAWKEKLLFPALEISGPVEYRLSGLKELSLPKDVRHDGTQILGYLKLYRLVSGCLGLRDFEELSRLDRELLARHFHKKNLLGWKSVIAGRQEALFVPCLMLKKEQVSFRWMSVTDSDIGEGEFATYRFLG